MFFRFSLRSQIDDFSFAIFSIFVLNSSWNIPFSNFSFLVFSFADYFSKISCRTHWGIVKILSLHWYAYTVFDANVSSTIFLSLLLSVCVESPGCKDLFMVTSFLVCWFIDLCFSLVQLRNGPMYPTIDIVQLFIHFIWFLQFCLASCIFHRHPKAYLLTYFFLLYWVTFDLFDHRSSVHN